jgi:hypothetical protein
MPALQGDMKNNHEHWIQMLLLHAASSYPLFTQSGSNIKLHNRAGDFASSCLDIPCWTQAQHGTLVIFLQFIYKIQTVGTSPTVFSVKKNMAPRHW